MADQINVSADDRAVVPQKAQSSRWGRRLLTMLVATAAVGGFAVVVVYSYDKGQMATIGRSKAVLESGNRNPPNPRAWSTVCREHFRRWARRSRETAPQGGCQHLRCPRLRRPVLL